MVHNRRDMFGFKHQIGHVHGKMGKQTTNKLYKKDIGLDGDISLESLELYPARTCVGTCDKSLGV